jgi:hypothetical protein
MMGGKGCGDFEIGGDAGIDGFRERNARFPGINIARYASGKDHRPLGTAQDVGRLLDEIGRGHIFNGRHEARGLDRRHGFGKFALLHLSVEVDVSRTTRRCVGNPVCA